MTKEKSKGVHASIQERGKRNHLVIFSIVLFMFAFIGELRAYRLDPIMDATRVPHMQRLERMGVSNPAALAAALGLSADEGLLKVRERKNDQGITSTWYCQTYQGVPVWGHQLNIRTDAGGRISGLYGTLVLDIPADLGMRGANIMQTTAQSMGEIKAKYLDKRQIGHSADIIFSNEKELGTYIFANETTGKVEYANFVSFFVEHANGRTAPEQPLIAVNPQTGEIIFWKNKLKDYAGNRAGGDHPPFQATTSDKTRTKDTVNVKSVNLKSGTAAVTTESNGFGPGGNERTGEYYYVTNPSPPNRPPFKVTYNDANGISTMDSTHVKTIDLGGGTNLTPGLPAYSFNGDTNTEPVTNGAYGPLNDAQFFGQVVYDTYTNWYGTAPVSQKIELRVNYGQNVVGAWWKNDTKFAYFSSGDSTHHPYVVLDVVAHEISHGFSFENELGEGFDAQGGAICESFNDMAGEACEFYLKGSNDFLAGADLCKGSGALRHMANPTQDEDGIDNMNDINMFNETNSYILMGIFNKAFYTLANLPGWTTRKAFKIFLKANQDIWTYDVRLQQGAEGARDAAIALDYSCADVKSAFAVVGINLTCSDSQNSLTLTSPDGGESWKACTGHDITWNKTGTIANVRIEYSTDNGSSWDDIVATTPNNGSYRWTIPNTPSTDCLVRISDAADNNPSGTSNANFSIVPSDKPDLTVTEIQFEKVDEGVWNAFVTVKNQCGIATPAGKAVRADIQIQGNPEVQGYNAVPSLAAGQSAVIAIGLENCYPQGASFTGIAVVDKLNEIDEENETNNMLQKEFVNGDLPGAPALNSPANNANVCTTTPTLKWYAVTATPAVDYYQVQINNASGGQVYASGNLTATSLAVPVNILHSGTTYTWHVRAHNSLGWGELSGRTLNISVIGVPGNPTLSTPANNETVCTKTPTLKWGAVGACPAVDYYQAQIKNSGGTTLHTSGNLTATSYVVPAGIMNSNTSYTWQVRAHNSSGWSAWSARTIIIGNISVPGTPVLVSPGNNVTVYTLTPTLKWEALAACPAVNYYQLQIKYTNGTIAYTSGNLTSTIFTVPAEVLYGGTTYIWSVRAHNASGWGNWISRTIKIYQDM